MPPAKTPTASAIAIARMPTLMVVVQLTVTATIRAPTESHARFMGPHLVAWVEAAES